MDQHTELLSLFPTEIVVFYLGSIVWFPSECKEVNYGIFSVIYCFLTVSNGFIIIIKHRTNLKSRIIVSQSLFMSITLLRAKLFKCLPFWSPELALISTIASIIIAYGLSWHLYEEKKINYPEILG